MIQVTRADIIELYRLLDVDADEWGPKKMKTKLASINKSYDEHTTTDDDFYDDLLSKLYVAAELNQEVEITTEDLLEISEEDLANLAEAHPVFEDNPEPVIKVALAAELEPVKMKEYDIAYKGIVSVVTPFGLARFDPNDGMTAADVLVACWERCGAFINNPARRKYTHVTGKRKVFFLWNSKYKETWGGTRAELAERLKEEASADVSTSSILTWISKWKTGTDIPVM